MEIGSDATGEADVITGDEELKNLVMAADLGCMDGARQFQFSNLVGDEIKH